VSRLIYPSTADLRLALSSERAASMPILIWWWQNDINSELHANVNLLTSTAVVPLSHHICATDGKDRTEHSETESIFVSTLPRSILTLNLTSSRVTC